MDTDSFIVDAHVADDLQEAFASLNPYDGVAGELDVLEVETAKHPETEEEIELRDVSFLAVGVKKYAVFDDGYLLKYTEHGLGAYEQFRDTEVIEAFWRALLIERFGVENQPRELYLNPEQLHDPLIFQHSASTFRMLELMHLRYGKNFHYRDWINQAIAKNSNKVFYFDIGDKEDAIKIQPGEARQIISANLNEEDVETAKTVMNRWWKRGKGGKDGRHSVIIVDTKRVTKESASTKLDWYDLTQNVLAEIAKQEGLETILAND